MNSNLISGKPKFLLIGLVAILIFGYQVNAFYLSQSTKTWPTVRGRVSTSEIETARGGRRGRSVTERAVVEYSYFVEGERYTGDRVRVSDGSDSIRMTQWNARGIVEDYPVGATVNVSYDPDDPANAVLDSTLPISSYVWMLISATVLAICTACCMVGNKR